MIHKCSCPECVTASLRNLDALGVFVLRLAMAGAEARQLSDQGETMAARDVIDAAAIKAGDLAQDMIAYAHLLRGGPAEEAPITERAAGRLH